MSAQLAIAEPRRIKATHRRRRKVTAGHFVQRYYDPGIGRFLSNDPVSTGANSGGNFNRYWYANNNPYRFTDPDGRFGWDSVRDFISPTGGELARRGEAGTARSNAIGAVKQLVNTAVAVASMANPGTMVSSMMSGPALPIANNELEGAAAAELVTGLVGAVAGIAGTRSALGNSASGLGDLTRREAKQIQGVVNQAGRPLDVVGSAASGTRRGVGSDLPIGKGPGTRSDIDYTTAGSNSGNFKGLEQDLPSLAPHGILKGTAEPGSPSIRFEPNP